jgi:hypothetical protein
MEYLLSSYKDDPAAYNLIKASLLQKLIRRGMIEESNYVAQLYLNDNQSKGLKRRLQIIAAEDIGIGWPESSLYLESQPDLIKVTSALAQANKNREADRFLLVLDHSYPSVLNRGSEIKKEVDSLKYLEKLSDKWFDSKSKVDLNAFKEALTKLANISKMPDIIIQLNTNHIDLMRAKIHGASCTLALAVLLSIRQVERSNWSPNETLTQIKPFNIIYDFAIDMHTPIGKRLGRDANHWLENCTIVIPEVKYNDLYDSNGNEKYPLIPKSDKK